MHTFAERGPIQGKGDGMHLCGKGNIPVEIREKIGSVQPPFAPHFVLGLSLRRLRPLSRKQLEILRNGKSTLGFHFVEMEVHVRRPNNVTNILSFLNKCLLGSLVCSGVVPLVAQW